MKVLSAIIGGFIGVGITIYGVMCLWAGLILPLIPHNEYYGLIKLVVGIVCVFFFGGIGFWLCIAMGMLVSILLLSLFPTKKRV